MQVANIIQQKITSKKIPVGQKLPPQEDLRKMFNVSIDTVLEALSNLVKDGYISRRPNRGTIVINSKPKAEAVLTRKNGICLVLCTKSGIAGYDYRNLMYQLLIKGLQEKIRERDAYLIFNMLNEEDGELCLGGKERDVAGLIVAGFKTPKHIRVIRKSKIPFILVGDVISKTGLDEIADVIANNDFDGVYMAAKHLTGLGHRRIACFHEPLKYAWDREKLEGYKQALRESGIVYDKDLLIEIKRFDVETGYKVMKEFLDKNIPFTGLISGGPNCVYGIMQAIKEKGLNVPENISMVDLGSEEYTSVFYDLEEIGRVAFDRLYYRLTSTAWKPERILVPNKLTVRGSTRKLL
jgi:LacI family transcriptional regulator